MNEHCVPMPVPRVRIRRAATSPVESPARRRRRVLRIIERLKERYPQVRVPLKHRDPFQLLVSTILSAQCTDAMVNRVTPVLFEKFRTPQDFAAARPGDVQRIIRPTGFFRQKIEQTADAIPGTGTFWQYGRVNYYNALK